MHRLMRILGVIVVLAAFGAIPVEAQEKSDKVLEAYPLGDINYDEIAPTLKAVKSPTGSINYVKGANKVFVYDTPAVHKLVKGILLKSSKPAVNITVDIDFQNMKMIRDRGLTLGGTMTSSQPGRSHRRGIRGSVDISGRDRTTTREEKNTMSLMVSSGQSGELWSTADALDTAALKRYGLEPWQAAVRKSDGSSEKRSFPEDFVRAIGTHMWVQPTYLPSGLVRVEIFPVVRAETSDGKETFFRVQRVRTLVTVAPGQRVFIGGTNNAMKTFFRELFKVGSVTQSSEDSLSIYLTAQVRIMNSSTPSKAAPVRPNRDTMWKHFPEK